MNELVTIHEGKFPIDGRELHEKVQSKQDYTTWVKNRIEKCRFFEGVDFTTSLGKSTGGRPTTEYSLTLYAAKHIAMLENTDAGFAVRDYFIQVEEKWSQGETKQIMSIEDLIIAQATSMKDVKLQLSQQSAALQTQGQAIKQLTAKVETRNTEYYTVAGYASLRGIKIDVNKASLLGRKATKLSQEYGVDVGKTHDPRFGHVNTYHLDVLKEVLGSAALM